MDWVWRLVSDLGTQCYELDSEEEYINNRRDWSESESEKRNIRRSRRPVASSKREPITVEEENVLKETMTKIDRDRIEGNSTRLDQDDLTDGVRRKGEAPKPKPQSSLKEIVSAKEVLEIPAAEKTNEELRKTSTEPQKLTKQENPEHHKVNRLRNDSAISRQAIDFKKRLQLFVDQTAQLGESEQKRLDALENSEEIEEPKKKKFPVVKTRNDSPPVQLSSSQKAPEEPNKSASPDQSTTPHKSTTSSASVKSTPSSKLVTPPQSTTPAKETITMRTKNPEKSTTPPEDIEIPTLSAGPKRQAPLHSEIPEPPLPTPADVKKELSETELSEEILPAPIPSEISQVNAEVGDEVVMPADDVKKGLMLLHSENRFASKMAAMDAFEKAAQDALEDSAYRKLFNFIPNIILLHKQFREDLEKAIEEDQLGRCLIQYSSFFQIHAKFADEYEDRVKFLKQIMKKTITKLAIRRLEKEQGYTVKKALRAVYRRLPKVRREILNILALLNDNDNTKTLAERAFEKIDGMLKEHNFGEK